MDSPSHKSRKKLIRIISKKSQKIICNRPNSLVSQNLKFLPPADTSHKFMYINRKLKMFPFISTLHYLCVIYSTYINLCQNTSILCIYADLRPTNHFYCPVFAYFEKYCLSVYVNGSLAHKNTPMQNLLLKKFS